MNRVFPTSDLWAISRPTTVSYMQGVYECTMSCLSFQVFSRLPFLPSLCSSQQVSFRASCDELTQSLFPILLVGVNVSSFPKILSSKLDFARNHHFVRDVRRPFLQRISFFEKSCIKSPLRPPKKCHSC